MVFTRSQLIDLTFGPSKTSDFFIEHDEPTSVAKSPEPVEERNEPGIFAQYGGPAAPVKKRLVRTKRIQPVRCAFERNMEQANADWEKQCNQPDASRVEDLEYFHSGIADGLSQQN